MWCEFVSDVRLSGLNDVGFVGISVGAEVPEVDWCEPGEDAALEALQGSKDGFLTKRLTKYENRNDPTKHGSLSGLSPYLHFGHISPQRAALEAHRVKKKCPKVWVLQNIFPPSQFTTPIWFFYFEEKLKKNYQMECKFHNLKAEDVN